jgi:hypothetical protein
MSMLDEAMLDVLLQADAKASAGPWTLRVGYNNVIRLGDGQTFFTETSDDAAFIVLAKSNLAALVQEFKASRERVAALESVANELQAKVDSTESKLVTLVEAAQALGGSMHAEAASCDRERGDPVTAPGKVANLKRRVLKLSDAGYMTVDAPLVRQLLAVFEAAKVHVEESRHYLKHGRATAELVALDKAIRDLEESA